jgi:tRNA 2-thiouridine synthesizing protein A
MNQLDATEMVSPMPILKARRRLEKMAVGEMLEIRATDRESVQDIPAFCQTSGHQLIMAREEGEVIIFEIKKGERPSLPDPDSIK